ncbi:hypothetical protein CNR22_00490 [Sphingobacteriaceae bacterium]|nr:hypothetical protein CNR22_00490 [Sphingobacteriaceae bacterium]
MSKLSKMEIEIYASGNSEESFALFTEAMTAVTALNANVTIKLITDPENTGHNSFLFLLPVLVIDGKVMLRGRVPKQNEIREMISDVMIYEWMEYEEQGFTIVIQ